MSLIRLKPHRRLPSLPSLRDSFFAEDFPFFGAPLLPMRPLARTFEPAVELTENDDSYVIRAELPGLKKDDLTIEVKDRTLVLKGEKKQEHEETNGGSYRSERQYGSFQRSFYLGDKVDAEKIKAKHEDGVLEVTISKTEESKPVTVTIS